MSKAIIRVVLDDCNPDETFDPGSIYWRDMTVGEMLVEQVRKNLARSGLPVQTVDLVR